MIFEQCVIDDFFLILNASCDSVTSMWRRHKHIYVFDGYNRLNWQHCVVVYKCVDHHKLALVQDLEMN